MKKYFLPALLLIILSGFIYFSKNLFKPPEKNIVEAETIAVGQGNPGTIALFTKEASGNFTRKTIDTGFRYVWTVRIADGRSDGKNRIYAGVGNSFFSEPHGCQVLEFDSTDNFRKTVIDEVGDLRCKDLTTGSIYNNGKNQLVLGTHGLGIVRVYDYKNGKWETQEVSKNSLAVYDRENNQNHAVPADKLPYDLTVQTAVHTVKIGDADNDGKNELLTTESDPLENPNKDHLLFIRMYKWNGKSFDASTIDTLNGSIPFKATARTVDLDGSGKSKVLVSASHHQVLLYEYSDGKWNRQVIDKTDGGNEDNMKGLSVGSLGGKNKSIVVATGLPHAGVYQYDLQDGQFNKKNLVDISKLLDIYRLFEGVGDNTLDSAIADIDGDGGNEIVVAGEQDSAFSGDKAGVSKFGWEGTTIGYTAVIYPQKDGTYKTEFIDFRSALALDVGSITGKNPRSR